MTLVDPYGRTIPEREDPSQYRSDRWQNWLTGIGTTTDKSVHGWFHPVMRVLDQELTSLHSGSDIAAKVVDKRPEEMFRRGFEIAPTAASPKLAQSDIDDVSDYAEETLDLTNNLLEGSRWGRLYGGAVGLLDIDDGLDPWQPVNEKAIRRVNSISVVDRRYAYVMSQYATIGANRSQYGRAEVYLVSNAIASWGGSYGPITKRSAEELRGKDAQVSLWHESRVIRFDGNPTDILTKQMLAGWSWSVLQRIYDQMRSFEHAFDSVGHLLSDASQGVFRLQGLLKAISSGQRQAIVDRALLMEQTRSVMRGILLDAGTPDGRNGEEFKREPTPFNGIPDLLDKMMLRLAAAADMPVTELFGRAPAGMNATGENDTRKWYDTIATEQTKFLTPKLRRIFRLISLAKEGPLKGKETRWNVKYHPLWQPTDDEVSKKRLQDAQRDEVYVTTGVVRAEEVAVGLDEIYPQLDVEAREQILEASRGEPFDPDHETQAETGEGSDPTQGEPLSPASPVPLLGKQNLAPLKAALRGGVSKNRGKRTDAKKLPDAAIAIVRDAAGRVLTVSRPEPPHEMSIPGGIVDPGETPAQAAVRELKEETGVDISNLRPAGRLKSPTDGRTVHVFVAGRCKGAASAIEPHTRVVWMQPDALYAQSQKYRNAIEELMNRDLLISRATDAHDGATMDALPALLEYRQDAREAAAVFGQLLDDYPSKDLGWVLAGHWEGPEEIPTDQIDSSNRQTWTATHDGRLPHYVAHIKAGRLKPIILVKPDGSDKFLVVDGHHRFLAYEALGRPAVAYWAEVHTKNGPWDVLHSSQKKGSSKGSFSTRSYLAQIDPKGVHAPSRSFGFSSRSDHGQFRLPLEHKPYLVADKGGGGPFSCAQCRYLDKREDGYHCKSSDYARYQQGDLLVDQDGKTPLDDPSRACSDWFERARS